MSPRARTEKEQDAVRVRLLRAGRERFARYGLSKVTIDELVRDAHISKGSFYTFFDSKEHLFIEVKNLVEEEIFVRFRRQLDEVGDDARAVLTEFFLFPQRHIAEEPFIQEVFRPGVMELVAERVGADAANGRDVPRSVIGGWVEVWHETGVLDDSITIEKLVGLASIFGAAIRSRQFFTTDYDATIELAVDCVVAGLLSGPGSATALA